MTTIAASAEKNIDTMIANSLKGEGMFADHFGTMKLEMMRQEQGRNSLRTNKLDDAQIEAAATQQLHTYAKGNFKKSMLDAAKGEGSADKGGMNFEQMAGMAGAVGQVSGAAQSGSILGWLSVIPTVMAAFGEYITAFFQAFSATDEEKKNGAGFGQRFSDRLQDIRADKQLAGVAKSLGVNSEELKKQMSAGVSPAAQQAAAANTPAGKRPAANTGTQDAANIELDKEFDSNAQAVSEVQKMMSEGKIKIHEDGTAFATPEAVERLDTLSRAPGNTPQGQPNPLTVKVGTSWAKNA